MTDLMSENDLELLLYYDYPSYYSQKVLMFLYEKDINFQPHIVSLLDETHKESWFLKLNPKGQIPVLVDGAKVISDSEKILEYLEDNFSNGKHKRLIPTFASGSGVKDEEERSKVLDFHRSLSNIDAQVLTLGSVLGNPPNKFKDWGLYKYYDLTKESWFNKISDLESLAKVGAESSDVYKQHAKEMERQIGMIREIEELFEEVDRVLSKVEAELDSHDVDNPVLWLSCNTFTVADCILAVLLHRLYQIGREDLWTEGEKPHLQIYYERIKLRDSFILATKIPSSFTFHIYKHILKRHQTFILSFLGSASLLFLGGLFVYRRFLRFL